MKIRLSVTAAALLFSLPVLAKDAGWQWYNESLKRQTEEPPAATAQPAQPDIMEKLATLQQATKRAMYEAILYPGVENFTRYFRLQITGRSRPDCSR